MVQRAIRSTFYPKAMLPLFCYFRWGSFPVVKASPAASSLRSVNWRVRVPHNKEMRNIVLRPFSARTLRSNKREALSVRTILLELDGFSARTSEAAAPRSQK